MKGLYLGLVALCLFNVAVSLPVEEGDRDEKVLALFNMVSFPNDVCVGNGRNGTCYTTAECSSKGGTAGAACAGGFGVCCTVLMSCGNMTSVNNTYLIQSAITTQASACTYTICKSDPSVCRIKFDFQTLTLADPAVGTAADGAVIETNGAAIGDCTTDTFAIEGGSPGTSPPQICGKNNGQHMIVDASDNCHTVNINIGAGDTTTSRSWTIAVSQYTCAQEDLVGPSGCLQYHIGITGRILDYGKNTNVVAAQFSQTTTHLSNQNYEICIRREKEYCAICYLPSIVIGTGDNSATFGLSISKEITANSDVGSNCMGDHITIPGGQTKGIAVDTAILATDSISQFCGRYLNTDREQAASASICSRVTPFMVGVHFDADEATTGTINVSQTNEQSEIPAGTVGFDLRYAQQNTNC